MSGNMGMIYNQKDTGDNLKGQCKAEQTWCTTTVLFQTALIVSAMHLTFTINYHRIPYIRLWSTGHIIYYSFSVRINLWVSLAVGLQLPAMFLLFNGRKSCCLSRTWQIKKNRQSFVCTAYLKVRFQSFPKVWSCIIMCESCHRVQKCNLLYQKVL